MNHIELEVNRNLMHGEISVIDPISLFIKFLGIDLGHFYLSSNDLRSKIRNKKFNLHASQYTRNVLYECVLQMTFYRRTLKRIK